jgi:hypothetical protein
MRLTLQSRGSPQAALVVPFALRAAAPPHFHVRGNMKRWRHALVLVLCCAVTGTVGYWFGFREAIPFVREADSLSRGALAPTQLNAIRDGETDITVAMLEYDVDIGLINGHNLFQHPLRNIVGPVWGVELYPRSEQSVVRMANYRQQHPSQMKPEMFSDAPHENAQDRQLYQEMLARVRQNIATVSTMVERYATKP